MKRFLHKIIASAIMLIALQITLTAQPVGSQIKTDTSGHISYWNGVDAWIPVAPGLPGQTLKFTAGVPSWVNNPNGITTTAVSNITGNTALSGGNVISDGGAKITARGVCWSTLPNPTIADNKTIDGVGIGGFTSNISGLNSGATYYIRAYATNSNGTAYGNEIIIIQPDPVAWFPFDGNTNDSTGNGNNGVNYSAISTTDRFGNANKAYYFNGNGSTYIKIPQISWNSIGYGDFSISVWAKPEDFGNHRMILNDNTTDNFQLNFNAGGGTIQMYLNHDYSNYNSNNYNFIPSEWYFITVTRNNGIKKYYINGQEYGSFNQNTSIAISSYLEIGGRSNGSQHPFIGSIDELKIYRRALNTTEITSNYLYGKVLDIDGNVYDTIHIGTQVWLKQNLKTTHYNNGTAIAYPGTDNTAWQNNITGSYAWYNNDEATYKNTYGALYNWYAVNTGNLCPTGWHVPTDAEWLTLTSYLGGDGISGGKLKETGLTHWISPNNYATNSSGFTALPGGKRSASGTYGFIGEGGFWWSSTEDYSVFSWGIVIYNNSGDAPRVSLGKPSGLSVRCLKD